MSSCVPYTVGVSGAYDDNDYYYIEGSPYYHTQHYYNDYYYDYSSPYYHHQHYYRDNNLEIQHNNRSFSHDRAAVQPQRSDRALGQPQRHDRAVNNNYNNNRNERSVAQPERHDRAAVVQPQKRVVNNSKNEKAVNKSNNRNSKPVDTHKNNKDYRNR
jgi:hypothetical protein